MPAAATVKAATSWGRSRPSEATTSPSAAITRLSGPWTGTATEQAPSVISSRVVANPSRRTLSSCWASSRGDVTV